MTAKKSTKTGKNFRGGGEEFFWRARTYTPDSRGWVLGASPLAAAAAKLFPGLLYTVRIYRLCWEILLFGSTVNPMYVLPLYLKEINNNNGGIINAQN